MAIRQIVFRNLSNIPGWRTNRKIIVIESDDWGSIRIPSKRVFNKFVKSGIRLDRNHFSSYDSLESNADIEPLLSLLAEFKDFKGNNPVFTAMSLVANPDFEKIKKEKFETYYYEEVNSTYLNYPSSDKVLRMIKDGIKNKLFIPQFHGREHLNVMEWLRGLRAGLSNTLYAFENYFTGVPPLIANESRVDYQAAFDLQNKQDISYHKEVINDGLGLFEKTFGYKASYFVPPNGPYNSQLDQMLSKSGVRYINGAKIRKEPQGNGKTSTRFHYLGQQTTTGLTYLTRNALFEPANRSRQNWVDTCLSDISIAFKWHKPAIISTHRVNYMGVLDERNRTNGLHQLKQLLSAILKKWPDVEFMTSNELGDLIRKKQ